MKHYVKKKVPVTSSQRGTSQLGPEGQGGLPRQREIETESQ